MWVCEHCNTNNKESDDLCWFCEACGCLLDEHYCGQMDDDVDLV
jgi:hypothetical protein